MVNLVSSYREVNSLNSLSYFLYQLSYYLAYNYVYFCGTRGSLFIRDLVVNLVGASFYNSYHPVFFLGLPGLIHATFVLDWVSGRVPMKRSSRVWLKRRVSFWKIVLSLILTYENTHYALVSEPGRVYVIVPYAGSFKDMPSLSFINSYQTHSVPYLNTLIGGNPNIPYLSWDLKFMYLQKVLLSGERRKVLLSYFRDRGVNCYVYEVTPDNYLIGRFVKLITLRGFRKELEVFFIALPIFLLLSLVRDVYHLLPGGRSAEIQVGVNTGRKYDL